MRRERFQNEAPLFAEKHFIVMISYQCDEHLKLIPLLSIFHFPLYDDMLMLKSVKRRTAAYFHFLHIFRNISQY